jgi:hypothetical protein
MGVVWGDGGRGWVCQVGWVGVWVGGVGGKERGWGGKSGIVHGYLTCGQQDSKRSAMYGGVWIGD